METKIGVGCGVLSGTLCVLYSLLVVTVEPELEREFR